MNTYVIVLAADQGRFTRTRTIDADDYRIDTDGYLSFERDKEEIAHFVPGHWLSVEQDFS